MVNHFLTGEQEVRRRKTHMISPGLLISCESGVTDFRVIPSVEQLRQREAMRALETRYGRGALLDALRAETAALRERLSSGHVAAVTVDEAVEAIERGAEARLRAAMRPSLVRVINATGVIVHTNL